MFINRQFFKYIHQTHLSFPVYLFLQVNGPGRALVKTCDMATCLSLVQKSASVISTFGCHAAQRVSVYVLVVVYRMACSEGTNKCDEFG